MSALERQVRHHLDLWPDQGYHLRREWLGKPEPRIRDEVGRWSVDPERSAVILHGASEMPTQFEIMGPTSLRKLDMSGGYTPARPRGLSCPLLRKC